MKENCRAWEIFRFDGNVAPHGLSTELAYLAAMECVEGWLDNTAAGIIHRLLRLQVAYGIAGNVLEIGVHHGRLFILLLASLESNERGIAVDLFEDQHLNQSHSGRGDRDILERNIVRYVPRARVELIQANSMDLGESFIGAHRGVRFVSVDGAHTREATCSDLFLVERLLVPGGIVALDDIYRPDWSGVTAGLHRYYDKGGTLIPFAIIPNKVLFASSVHYARDYRDVVRNEFAFSLDRIGEFMRRQQFFEFDDVLYCPAA